MNLFFAAPGNTPDLDSLLLVKHPYLLLSYHYFKNSIDLVKTLKPDRILFIDSGAFSAFTKNIEIDLDAYCLWIKTLQPNQFANLDVIGNPEQTYQNQIYIETHHSLNPLPVFHMNENIEYLYRYLNYEYICLGGMVKNEGLEPWLDEVFSIIYKNNPHLKVHGFGLTGSLLEKYPFFSIDSSSWANGVRFANISLFNKLKNKLYDIDLTEYCASVGVKYSKGDPITGWMRDFVINVSCYSHIKFNDYITELHKTQNFDYLTAQLKLF